MTFWAKLRAFFRREDTVSPEYRKGMWKHDAEATLEESLGTAQPRKRERGPGNPSAPGAFSREWGKARGDRW